MKSFVRLSALSLALFSTGCADGYADTADSVPEPSSSSPAQDAGDAAPGVDAITADSSPPSSDAAPAMDGAPAVDARPAEDAGTNDAGAGSAIGDAAVDSPSCPGAMADCDQDPSHLCEINLNLDPLNCGACGNACPASAQCVGGACKLQCQPLWADCNGVLSDGCETDLDLEENCGACGKACGPVPFGHPICWDTVCYTGCDEGRKDCDHVYDNGCEIDRLNDVANCGDCGTVCSFPNAVPSCVDGKCGIGSCKSGWADCNADLSDGCETYLHTTENCGFCGHDCGDGVACWGGTCSPVASFESGEIRGVSVSGQLAALATERGVATTYGFGPSFLDPEDFLAANSTAFAIAADDSGVYWLEHNGLLRRTTGSGTAVTNLATGLVAPIDLGLDSKNVYVIANGKLGRISKSGGAITLMASNLSAVERIDVDSDAVYSVTGTKISRVLKVGYATQLIVTAAAPVRAIHVQAGYLYWLADDEIWRIPSAGGLAEHVVSAPDVTDFCLGSSAVYFTTGTAVVRYGAQGLQGLAVGGEPAMRIALAKDQLWWVAGNKAYRTPS